MKIDASSHSVQVLGGEGGEVRAYGRVFRQGKVGLLLAEGRAVVVSVHQIKVDPSTVHMLLVLPVPISLQLVEMVQAGQTWEYL